MAIPLRALDGMSTAPLNTPLRILKLVFQDRNRRWRDGTDRSPRYEPSLERHRMISPSRRPPLPTPETPSPPTGPPVSAPRYRAWRPSPGGPLSPWTRHRLRAMVDYLVRGTLIGLLFENQIFLSDDCSSDENENRNRFFLLRSR